MILNSTPAPVVAARIVSARVVTVDEAGDERWWDLPELLAAHPELIPPG